MIPLLPNNFKKEQGVLLARYMQLPDGTDWNSFFIENASEEFLSYLNKKKKQDLELYKMGIIEN